MSTFTALLLFRTCSSRLTIYSSHFVLSLNMFHCCSAYCMTKIASIDLLTFYTEQTLILWCHKCNHKCFHFMLIDFPMQYLSSWNFRWNRFGEIDIFMELSLTYAEPSSMDFVRTNHIRWTQASSGDGLIDIVYLDFNTAFDLLPVSKW